MSIGIWKGFVGVPDNHLFYDKNIDELLLHQELLDFFFSIHGGVCSAGRLPAKYKEYTKNLWWVGMETSHGNDLMPLLKLDLIEADMSKMLSNQTYKDLSFIRKEINKMAKYLSKVKPDGTSD
jgi:hypothetical protein